MRKHKKTSGPSSIETLAQYLDLELKVKNNFQSQKQQLINLKQAYLHCLACPLGSQGRSQVVFGSGNPQAKLMFIGEGPGKDEDTRGEPFVGRAGKLLNKIIAEMNLKRENIYITNVVKCRPPKNRAPLSSESSICKQLMLFKEIEIIQPQIICTLGVSALYAVLGPQTTFSKLRGELQLVAPYKIMPTYHPAYLLRNPSAKSIVLKDMEKIIKEMS